MFVVHNVLNQKQDREFTNSNERTNPQSSEFYFFFFCR